MFVKLLFSKYFQSILIIITTLTVLTPCNSFSQDNPNSEKTDYSKQVDLKDVLRKLFHKPKSTKVDVDTTGITVSLLPGISYNPANGLIIGAVASLSKYYGSPSNTNISSFAASASYTSKNQIKLSAQSSIFRNKNDWIFQGDWRFWKYSQDTYGLGTQSVPGDLQSMTFNYIRFNQNFLKKIIPNCYLGIGYSLDYYFKINTENDSDKFLYPNYNNSYNILHGYDSTSYLSSGFVFNMDYDSRDNSINPYKGVLADVKYYNYRKFLGSSQNWQKITYDFRAYKSLTKDDSYILAFWTLGDFAFSGNGPYMSLPATGWDKYNTSGRGYIQGRFRGVNFIYAGFENRIRLTSNGLLGMVLFINVESASNPDANIKLLDFIEPGGGIGLRIKFDKFSRTNICIDYGIGRYGSSAVFLNLGEFF